MVQHGTVTGYTNYRCRCDECKAVMNTYQREWRLRRSIPNDVHGTVNGYKNHLCRCTECRAANAAYIRGWRNDEQAPSPRGEGA